MNKKFLLGIGVSVLGLGLAFGGGVVATKATTDWQTNAINKAQSDLKQQAYDKANVLSNQASTDINAKVNAAVSDEMKAKQDELNQLMEQYYQMKLNGITNTAEFKSVEDQITKIQQWALDQYKSQIDQTFATNQAQ